MRSRFTLSFAGVLIAVCAFHANAGPRGDDGATLILHHARIWTGNARNPWAQAVAVRGNRIEAVGSDDEIKGLINPGIRVIDARGATVMPGFNDAHFHLLDLKTTGSAVPLNLRFASGRRDIADLVAEAARAAPEGAWIFGEGWDERKWGGEIPTKTWIDGVTPKNPVWLLRGLGDTGLANSAALRAAGIVKETQDGPAGGVVRDARGEPTGLIRGGPMWLVDRAIVDLRRGEAERSAQDVMGRLAQWGVTSVQHTGNWQELLVFQGLQRAGRLRTRIYAGVPLPAWIRLRDYVDAHGRGDDWLHWGALKLFKMTWTETPLSGPSGRRDRWSILPTAEDVYGWFDGAARAGLQTLVHAGGYEILKIYNRIQAESHPPDPRFRIEHAHSVPPAWIKLYAAAGVIASVQPPLVEDLAASSPPGAVPRDLFPCRRLLDAGVIVVFGTDSVTATPLMSPFEVIVMGLRRPGPDGRRLTLEQCLAAYTRDAAYAEFAEKSKGTLEAGKLADLILLDRDIFACPEPELGRVKVRLTVLDGRIIYTAEETAIR
jgi:predicted amidohydrolase YtcJ